jgi:vacuolar protein sorting-associated protein IST1
MVDDSVWVRRALQIIEKLSVQAPSGEVKLKLMKGIASDHNVDWDPTDFEAELLKAPEDLLVRS